jgi:glycerol-3-phosphate acyltransferase PlsX
MGGDNAPRQIIKGAVDALKTYEDFSLVLVGRQDIILEELKQYDYNKDRLEVVHAGDVIEMAESPVDAIKKKKDSSMVKGFNLLAQGYGEVFITAGSTGATVAGSILIPRRIKGVKRPALAPVIPTMTGGVLLIDCGANVDCKPSYLAQFAVMGSIYMKIVMGVENPRVGLVNNGAESEKGNMLTKAAFPLLQKAPINFVGNAEARYIMSGQYDVVVCDGFVGNVVLKLTEGVAETLLKMLKEELKRNFRTKLGTMLAMSAFRNFKKSMDASEYGGALLLGVNGGVIKAHGSSDAKAICSTIRQAREFVSGHVVDVIKEEIAKVDFEDETV